MKIPSLGILPVADAQAEPMDYIGICEASAAVALDDTHFVVASNETNTFQIYRRGTAKPLQANCTAPAPTSISRASPQPRKATC